MSVPHPEHVPPPAAAVIKLSVEKMTENINASAVRNISSEKEGEKVGKGMVVN